MRGGWLRGCAHSDLGMCVGVWLLLGCRPAHAQSTVDPHWVLVAHDDFAGMTNISGVDAHWYRSDNFQKNDEPGLFIDDNVTLIPGLGVRITTRKQEAVCSTCSTQVFHYTSGTMNGDCGIAPGGGVRYGYLEAYIKLSRTYGIWPSFWLWTETPLCDGVETQPCDNCYRDTLGVAFPPVGFVCNSPSVATCDYEEIDVFEMTCGYVETNPNAYNYGMVSTWNDATTHYYTTGYEHPNETGINISD